MVQHEAQKRPSRLLGELKLSPRKQRRVRDLVRDTRLKISEYETARIALLDETVRGVKVGQFSEERLSPLLESALTTFEHALPHLLESMNELHRLLSAKERSEFVDLLNGDSSKKLSKEERRSEKEERLSRVLDLNTGQKTRFFGSILALTLTHYSLVSGTRSGIKEAKESFISEDFEASKLRAVKELDLRALAMLTYEALQSALEILTPQQRQTLAALMVARMR